MIFKILFRDNRVRALAFWLSMLIVPMVDLASQITAKKGMFPFKGIRLFNLCYTLGLVFFYRHSLYKYYRENRQLFLAQLPIHSVYRSFSEIFAHQILAIFPVFLAIAGMSVTALLFNLWNFNGFLYFAFAEFVYVMTVVSISLLIAMSGRLFNFLLMTVLLSFIHYFQKPASYGFDLIHFMDPAKFYTSESLIAKLYIRLAIASVGLCLPISFALIAYRSSRPLTCLNQASSKIEKIVALILLLVGISYFSASKQEPELKFAGFNRQKTHEKSTILWSSAIPLEQSVVDLYAPTVARLGKDIEQLYQNFDIPLSGIHIQHNPRTAHPMFLGSPKKQGGALGITGNFDDLSSHYPEFLHEVFLEIIRMESKNWVMKESQILKWRGLAYALSGSRLEPDLDFDTWYADASFRESVRKRNWLQVYRELGSCYFDRFAGALFPSNRSEIKGSELKSFARSALNIEGRSIIVHLVRNPSLLFDGPLDLSIEKNLQKILQTMDQKSYSPKLLRPDFDLKLDEMYTNIYRAQFKLKNGSPEYHSIQIEIAQLDPTGWLIFDKMRSFPYEGGMAEPGFSFIKGETYYVSLSWMKEPSGCRIYGSWLEVSP